jgi:hypothetical protein
MIGRNGSYAHLPFWDRIGKPLGEPNNFRLFENWRGMR